MFSITFLLPFYYKILSKFENGNICLMLNIFNLHNSYLLLLFDLNNWNLFWRIFFYCKTFVISNIRVTQIVTITKIMKLIAANVRSTILLYRILLHVIYIWLLRDRYELSMKKWQRYFQNIFPSLFFCCYCEIQWHANFFNV